MPEESRSANQRANAEDKASATSRGGVLDLGHGVAVRRLRGVLVLGLSRLDGLDNKLAIAPSGNELVRRVEHQQQLNKHRITSVCFNADAVFAVTG
jgi:hypothetical protein